MSYLLSFNGERLDPVTGTTHLGNGYRAYSPVLMRFTCPDSWSPFGGGGMNPYAYCEGDPINRADPSGHMSWQAGLGIGLGILGILGAVFTGGASIAAAGSISAALATTSAVSLVVGTSALVADVTGIAQAATEESNPQASAALGWVSLALGVVAMGVGAAGIYSSKLAMRLSKQSIRELPTNGNVVTLGGQMENPHMITPQLMTFTEKMKRSGDVRLTILAHGERINGASAIPLGGEIYDAEKLHELVKVIYPDFSYDKVRFLSCFSAEGGSNSLAANYAKIVKKPAKGFVGTVSANLTPEKIVSIMDDLNFGSEVVMRRVKYNAVTVYKKNPYSFFTQNSASRNFSFSPLKFNSEGELWSDVI